MRRIINADKGKGGRGGYIRSKYIICVIRGV
jgi:hypothetical protein